MSSPGWGPPGGGPVPPPQPGWGPPAWGPPPGQAPPPVVCFRHPDRATGLRCARCGRPSCPECLTEAAVGFQCTVCVAEGRQQVRAATTVAGARLTPGTPVVTYALMGVNTALFVLTALLAGSLLDNQSSSFFERFALWPYGVAQGGLPRLLVSGFLHYGPLHLVLNMYALYILGRELEIVLGRGRYLAVYGVALLGGSTSVMLFQDPSSVTVGASGAVFGLMGALAVVLLKLKRSPAPVYTVIAVNIAISILVPGISLFGHLGGLVTGAAATAVLVYAPAPRRTVVQVGGLVGLVVLLVAIIGVRVLDLRSQIGL